jgi:hypothetical protein
MFDVTSSIMMFVLSASMFWWNYLFEYLYLFFRNKMLQDDKDAISLSQNTKNLIHACMFSFIYSTCGPFIYPYLVTSTFMYYLMDMYVLMKYMMNTSDYLSLLLVHHIISIGGLYYCYIGYHTEFIMYIFHLLDISNIVLYITYHYVKLYPQYTMMNYGLLIIELCWYANYRVYRFLDHILTNREIVYRGNPIGILMLFTIYAMGVVWSAKLVQKVSHKTEQFYLEHKYEKSIKIG